MYCTGAARMSDNIPARDRRAEENDLVKAQSEQNMRNKSDLWKMQCRGEVLNVCLRDTCNHIKQMLNVHCLQEKGEINE